MPQHLTPEQLTSYRDGNLDDPGAAAHIRGCPECRGELLNARLRSVLIGAAGDAALLASSGVIEESGYIADAAQSAPELTKSHAPDSAHPDESALSAYYSDALSPEDRAKVEAHLVDCPDCLEDLAWMRDALAAIDSTPIISRPAESVVFHALHRWGTLPTTPPLTPPVGKLFIEMFAGQRARMLFRPNSMAPGGLSGSLAWAAPGPSPSRRSRGEGIVREPAGQYPSEPPAPSSIHINIGPLRLALELQRTPAGFSLRATVLDPGTGEPDPAITLTLFTAEGVPIPPETDSNGQVTWRLPRTPSTLSIDADPQVNIEVRPVEE